MGRFENQPEDQIIETVLTPRDEEDEAKRAPGSPRERSVKIAVDEESEPESPESNSDRFNKFFKPIVNPVARVAENTIGFVIPKIERIPWYHFFFLSFIAAVPAGAYILGFTKIGFGLEVFYFLSRYYEQHAYILALSIGAFAFLLYLFDCYYWESMTGRVFRGIAIALLVLATAVLVCFISASHPYGPISLYIVATPMWLMLIKHVFYRNLSMRTYVPWLSGPLFFNAVVIMAGWIWWTFSLESREWTENTRLADAQASGCNPDFLNYPQCQKYPGTDSNEVCFEVDPANPGPPIFYDFCPIVCLDVFDVCSNMFIVWVGPFLVSLGLFFLSFFATFLKATGTIEQEALKFAKVWLFLLFAMWIASSLAGAGAGVSVTLAALTLSAFVASSILLAASFSNAERGEKVNEVWKNLLESYSKYLNVAKGLMVVTCAPVFLVYLAVSFLNQSIRNINLPCSRKTQRTESLKDVVGAGLFTVEARRLIKEVKSWDLVDVFTYAIYWGIGFMMLSVLAAKFTILFLSWLIEQCMDLSVGVVTGILLGVGVVMFLLPPVPGAPIYLTLGIVIIPVGRDVFGIFYSLLYAMAVSLLLKLFATFLQQKMIGGLLKSKVGIRQMVGINTPLIRAFKLVLSEPGFGMAKVSILCGGPDWPTSVLCGIMDLSIGPIFVGTLPVLILIVPTVLTGAFTYMSSLTLEDGQPEFTYAGTAATICAAISAVVLFGFILLAAYYVEITMREREEEVNNVPIDKEVKKLDDKQVLEVEAYREVTVWNNVPIWAKFLLVLSLTSMITCCYMVQLFQEDAFTAYQLTYTIDKHLDGDWTNLIKPVGFVALVLFAASIFFYIIFSIWAKGQARKRLKEKKIALSYSEDHQSEDGISTDSRKPSHVDSDSEIGVSIYTSISL
mmetsp:Transcript_1757/g.1957  ORF Transcript_1757/g.1957 Transcript_1757/m.1957 type:complete len:902 (-) Transcript_1757:112-2817(-)